MSCTEIQYWKCTDRTLAVVKGKTVGWYRDNGVSFDVFTIRVGKILRINTNETEVRNMFNTAYGVCNV